MSWRKSPSRYDCRKRRRESMFSSSILCDREVYGARSYPGTGEQEVVVVHDHHLSSVCKFGGTIHETLCIYTIHTYISQYR